MDYYAVIPVSRRTYIIAFSAPVKHRRAISTPNLCSGAKLERTNSGLVLRWGKELMLTTKRGKNLKLITRRRTKERSKRNGTRQNRRNLGNYHANISLQYFYCKIVLPLLFRCDLLMCNRTAFCANFSVAAQAKNSSYK